MARIYGMLSLKHFKDHPASVGESYTEHMGQAAYFGFRLLFAGLACLVHAVLPFLCVKTGSRAVAELNERMILKRRADQRVTPAPAGTHQPT
jgi:uncharacterized protein DUF6356